MWIAPAAVVMESAADSLKSAAPKMLTAEVKELGSFGSVRISNVMDVLWPLVGNDLGNALSGMQHDIDIIFGQGYLFGLEVARKILAESPLLFAKNIDPKQLL